MGSWRIEGGGLLELDTGCVSGRADSSTRAYNQATDGAKVDESTMTSDCRSRSRERMVSVK
ncbi:hypothetical protein CBOM_07247 [Ceraceosorus bombacis]|uniref:Uncharacterized protein n=1 Tax=Ceraceosorus bombacis TaxID=401625 RepID=A0A0P1B7H0_9BASI|nr:hypothetical protein CBOM_07247 [Ceraceosorus bombacis]